MKKVVLFGECMIELKQTGNSNTVPVQMQQGFAGDVFNAAVYLTRCFNDIDIQLFTALGRDDYSNNMKDYLKAENVGTDLILTSEDKIPGLYSIQTDSSGERSFTYWRNDAAARYTMELLTDDIIEKLKQSDMFVFSGISLAVIKPELRERFWQLIAQLKQARVEIVFDPNYRPRLWADTTETKAQYELALQASDYVLPGIEDFEVLYGLSTFEDVADFCKPYNIQELVIKDGPNGVLIIQQQNSGKNDNQPTQQFINIEPVKTEIDTTSARDSFNGVYLGARLSDLTVEQAVSKAAKTAGFVIQHPGAIVEKSIFHQFTKTL